MRRANLLGAILASVVAATQGASAQTAPPAMTPPPADAAAVVAVVNGNEIKRADIELFYQSLPPQYQQIPIETLFPQLVERYVDQRLIADAARSAGVANRPEVKNRIALLTEGLLNQAYMEERLRSQVSEDRVREEYQKSVALEPKKEEVHARHILVKTREEAVAVIVEIRGGADFAETAKKKSTGPSARTGGDLGFFTRDQMVPPFSEAAFALKAGEYTTEPVQTQFGWHVIKVEERRLGGARKFEEVADELRQSLTEKAYEGIISELRAKAKVEIIGAPKIQPVQ